MENVYIMNHPLIQHKISMLRNKNTGTNEFRKLTYCATSNRLCENL